MGTVFISHSSHDQSLASRLAGDLRQSGHSVWLDQSDLPAGASLAGSIQAGIAQSDAFVLLFSEQALNSGWVELEWQAALERKVADSAYTFLLCRLGDAEVPLILRGRKWIELRDEAEYALAVDAIRGSLVPPAPTTKAAPVVWYFDDVQESLDAFAERHASRFQVRTFSEVVDFLSALAQAKADSKDAPDVVLLDLYCPRHDADTADITHAEQGLVDFVCAEKELRTFVDAAWKPIGVEIVESVRDVYPPEKLPIVMHTQEGLFLLRDALVEELEQQGAGWLLKGRFSAETDRMVIERIMLKSGHTLGAGKPRVLIIDDNKKYIDAFIQRQADHYEIEAIETEAEVLRTLARLDAADRFPDVFVVDMYYPRGSDAESLERIRIANQKLKEFAEVERRLKTLIQASFEPLGLQALKQLRRVFSAEEVTAIVYAQSGMLLLEDKNIRDIERMGGGWLLKDRYDARTEQAMIMGELMRAAGHS